ncbi:hypothetical protein PR048_004305 [Dryococelus australis]|uniref:DNA helicase Pif1-like 2B domain-containing protein n=1 Tax=Dryococelus australis TaxID=614101 RepID=A0ABQ9I525_9NEOP|nr:hypothetical protein PR048_004305 [Dryococelus australis]
MLLPGGKTAHPGGKTAHSMFKIPLEANKMENPVCGISKNSNDLGCPLEIVDRTLRDIRSDDRPFSGVTFLFSGTLGKLWRLSQDVHVYQDTELPNPRCRVFTETEQLIREIYEDVENLDKKENFWLCERSILAPKNYMVSHLNTTILGKIVGDSITYMSINAICNIEKSVHFPVPVEFLNSIVAPGLPAHKIQQKIGVLIMLLSNLNPPKLCNGSRLKVVALQKNIIKAKMLTGYGKGDTVFIPWIPIIPINYPF